MTTVTHLNLKVLEEIANMCKEIDQALDYWPNNEENLIVRLPH
jgi:hypothetical protein